MSSAIETLVRQHRDCDQALEALEACLRSQDWDAAAGAFARLEAALQGNFLERGGVFCSPPSSVQPALPAVPPR
ncbi:hypothetical protein ACTMU2_25900 [Cupriavidus basilensis]